MRGSPARIPPGTCAKVKKPCVYFTLVADGRSDVHIEHMEGKCGCKHNIDFLHSDV